MKKSTASRTLYYYGRAVMKHWPFFILGIYEKNGLYVEWILFFFIKRVKLRSQIRKRKIITNKEKEERKEFVRKEIEELEDKEKNSLRSGEKSKAYT